MFSRKKLTQTLTEIGCKQLGPMLYSVPTSTRAVEHSVSFRLLGVYRWELDAWAGLKNRDAEAFTVHCLSEYAGERWREWTSQRTEGYPLRFVPQFPVGKLTNWGDMRALSIRDLSHDETAARVATDISQFLIPFLARVATERNLLEILLRDEEPMPWYQFGPLTRATHIVFLATRNGLEEKVYRPAIERHAKFIANQLTGVEAAVFLDRVIDAAGRIKPNRSSSGREEA
jgi:hypothetical protein